MDHKDYIYELMEEMMNLDTQTVNTVPTYRIEYYPDHKGYSKSCIVYSKSIFAGIIAIILQRCIVNGEDRYLQLMIDKYQQSNSRDSFVDYILRHVEEDIHYSPMDRDYRSYSTPNLIYLQVNKILQGY